MRMSINDIQLHYELSGRADAPVVVLSHALASSSIMWQSQMKSLEAVFRVLRYDMRGHGQSDTPEGPYSMEMLCEDVVGLLDALEIEQAHFVGLSIGGMIGQGLALDRSERLISVTLCDTTSITPEEAKPLIEERIEAIREHGMQSQAETTMNRWFTPRFLASDRPEKEVIRNQILDTSTAGCIGCLEAVRRLNFRDRLAQIGKPTLIMVGEEDTTAPVAASKVLHEHIPDSRLVVLPSAAHLANIEQTEIFNMKLLGFLQAR